jgi:hypothetical protein
MPSPATSSVSRSWTTLGNVSERMRSRVSALQRGRFPAGLRSCTFGTARPSDRRSDLKSIDFGVVRPTPARLDAV